MRIWSVSSIALAAVLLASGSAPADKLKGFYSGSGGVAQEVHRVVMIEFAADGTAIIQQNWEGKDPQTWHGHWTQDGKLVTVALSFTASNTGAAEASAVWWEKCATG